MSLLGERFEQDGISGVIAQIDPGRAGFEQARWVNAIRRAIPDLDVTSEEADHDEMKKIILGQLLIFGTIATFVRGVQGIGFDWPEKQTSPTLVQAFNFVVDHFASFQGVLDAINRVQRPNGVEGSPDSALSEAERKNPLSDAPDSAGKATD